MDIYLFRHGIAIDRADPACPPDPDRQLTDKGWSRTRSAARGIAVVGVRPAKVVTSPYRRARETAECVVDALGLAPSDVHVTEALVPEAEPDEICDELDSLGLSSVICCGHAPNLDEVIGYLLGSDREVTALKKAGFAWLRARRLEGAAGELVALLPPRVLRSLDGQ